MLGLWRTATAVGYVALLVLLGSTASALLAAENTAIQLNLEEPRAGAVYQGVTNLRGWAVAPMALDRIEAYRDGAYVFDVPLGGNRDDVGSHPVFGGYPNADRSGFSMALNYGDWSPGPHTLRVRAIDSNGDWRERSVDFEITRFAGDNYVEHPKEPVALDPLETEILAAADDDTAFEIRGFTVQGARYDLRLRWRNQAQGFAIEAITASAPPRRRPTTGKSAAGALVPATAGLATLRRRAASSACATTSAPWRTASARRQSPARAKPVRPVSAASRSAPSRCPMLAAV